MAAVRDGAEAENGTPTRPKSAVIDTDQLSSRLASSNLDRQPQQQQPVGESSNARMTSDVQSYEPNALLHGFTTLRAQLREHPDLSTFPLPLLFAPFLQVILSPKVSAPITSAALQSVNRLLVYQIVPLPTQQSFPDAPSSSPPGLHIAVIDIARAISHCRFEPSEPSTDELVLLRILAVMKELVCGTRQADSDGQGLTLADYLPDENVCELMETGLSMCCQTRLSDLLRKTAEQHLLPMVRHLFSRLPSLPLEDDEAYSTSHNVPPDHTSLAADDIEEVSSTTDFDEKKLRRMTMPDPRGLAVTPVGSDFSDGQSLSSVADVDGADQEDAIEEDKSRDDRHDKAEEQSIPTTHTSATAVSIASSRDQQAATSTTEKSRSQPFSLPAIKEVLRVLISLIDPQAPSHTDVMRLLGLNLLTAACETAGPQLARFPSLRAQIQDTGCKHLFQLARSESFAIVSYSTRAICLILQVMREELKLQYELLITFLMDRLAPTFPLSQEPWNEGRQSYGSAVPQRLKAGSSDSNRAMASPPLPPPPPPMPKSSDKAPASGDVRELTLDALVLLLGAYRRSEHAAHSGTNANDEPLLALYLNYDCDVDCEDLYVKMVHFLCRSIFASNPMAMGPQPQASQRQIQDSMQTVALDQILAFVERLTTRQELDGSDLRQGQSSWPSNFPSPESLEDSKGRKAAILEGAKRFNAKPKLGLAYLEEQGFISADASGNKDRSIAMFLKECPRLDKKLLGDYLSRPANQGVLDAFLYSFDFDDKPVAEAMREMLESFRLPGESQQIARITETFAKVYFAAADKAFIKSEDAVYVLAYSVIMLNTDLHNSQNKKKMSVEDYRRNLRGVNDGQDFDPDYLGSIYESIRKREIVMPEEHLGQLGFEYAWKELLRRSRSAGSLQCPITDRFDRSMFTSSWRPIVASIAHAFSTFKDEHLLERSISAFRQCALLASKWGMDEVFDFMIEGLATSTGLLDGPHTVLSNNAVVEVEETKVTVSPLSVKFGMDFKGQLAAVVLFTIANGNGQAIRLGWSSIFEILKNLFAAGLLPEELSSMQDFTSKASLGKDAGDATPTPADGSRVPIPMKPKRPAGGSQGSDARAAGGGLFSALSSYLLSPYGAAAESAPPPVNDEEVEASFCTIDCVASCRISELYEQLLHLESRDSVVSAVQSLRQLADRLTLGQLAAVAAAAHQQQDGSSGRSTPVQHGPSPSRSQQPLQPLPYDPRAVFALEQLTNVTCSAPSFIADTWSEAIAHVSSLLQSSKSFHPALCERAVVCLLRLVDAASEGGSTAEVSAALSLLSSLPVDVKPTLGPAIIAGLQDIFSRPRKTSFVQSEEQWNEALALISDTFATRSAHDIQLLSSLIGTIASAHLCQANSVAVVHLLRDLAQLADPEPVLKEVQKREKQGYRLTLTEKKELTEYVEACRSQGPSAVKRLEAVKNSIPIAAIDANGEASSAHASVWSQCWLTLTSALASQVVNGHRDTRQAAIQSLQVVLCSSPEQLSPTTSPPGVIRQILVTSLLPTLDQLLAPNVFPREREATGPGGVIEMRVKACHLLTRTMLNFVRPLAQLPPAEFQEVWLQVLDTLGRYRLAAGKNDALVDAIPENIKNLLLVFQDAGLICTPTEPDLRSASQGALWEATREKLQTVLPSLLEEFVASSMKQEQRQDDGRAEVGPTGAE